MNNAFWMTTEDHPETGDHFEIDVSEVQYPIMTNYGVLWTPMENDLRDGWRAGGRRCHQQRRPRPHRHRFPQRAYLCRYTRASRRPRHGPLEHFVSQGRLAGIIYYDWTEVPGKPDSWAIFRCGALTDAGKLALKPM